MTSETIQIELNGRAREVPSGRSLAGLLEDLDVDRRAVVVEHNREIVRGDELEGARLSDGDVVEVVHFVGGGRAGAAPR